MTTPASPPPSDADKKAAHQLASEFRTRILTQKLPYQHGVEARALESLFSIFELARKAMKENPGCDQFADLATDMLNVHVRPVTAKWHRASEEGRLSSKDGADEFRGDLAQLQDALLQFVEKLQIMAYGRFKKDEKTPEALRQADKDKCFEAVHYGLVAQQDARNVAGAKSLKSVVEQEAEILHKRRKNLGLVGAASGTRNTQASQPAPPATSAPPATKAAAPIVPSAPHKTDLVNAVGLALSGGGIRSATFCLGVVQVLTERKLLQHVDLLSTVSGGGYTGSFLTSVLGTKPKQASPVPDWNSLVGHPNGPDPDPIAELRANAKYLTAASSWDAWSRVMAMASGMLLNWTVPLSIVALSALASRWLVDTTHFREEWRHWTAYPAAFTGFAFIAYAFFMRIGEKASLYAGRILAVGAAATVVVGAFGFLVEKQTAFRDLPHPAIPLSLTAIVAAGPAVIRFLPVLPKAWARSAASTVLLLVAALAIPALAIITYYAVWTYADAHVSVFQFDLFGTAHRLHVMWAIGVGILLLAWMVLDINHTSPHRLYRDALAKTFLAKDAPTLEGLNETEIAPYQLVNAVVNLPASREPQLRDRKGDFFLFSKHWCGSSLTGYYETQSWRSGRGALTLKTAMAISGAAASSHMGRLSKPALAALITFLNVRLGVWLKRPPAGCFDTPGFLCMLREMTSIGMSETSSWLNLSDGGHIENTGCYELLRRRCKFVIAVDGEADPNLAFDGLLTLTRHAQINLGIRLDPRLDDLRKNPANGNSRRHSMLCRVHYPDGQVGLLLYLKLSTSGNESELIRRYRAMHADFPHQTTLDQFFDEEQFEAYRQLGVHVAEGLFSHAILGGKTEPQSVRAWFEALAENLLESAIS